MTYAFIAAMFALLVALFYSFKQGRKLGDLRGELKLSDGRLADAVRAFESAKFAVRALVKVIDKGKEWRRIREEIADTHKPDDLQRLYDKITNQLP